MQCPSEDGKVLKWEDLQGFWDMIKIQADNVDDMFAEIELMRQNGWKELNTHSHVRLQTLSWLGLSFKIGNFVIHWTNKVSVYICHAVTYQQNCLLFDHA